MRHIVALAFAITDIILYYFAYFQHDENMLHPLLILWWVSAGLTAIFTLLDILNGKIGTVIGNIIGTAVSAWIFFNGVMHFQAWALALSFWIAFGLLCLYALIGVVWTILADLKEI